MTNDLLKAPGAPLIRRRSRSPVVCRAVAVAAACALGGCAHSIKEIARETSSAAVDETIEQLGDEGTQRKAAEAAQDPRVEAALAAVTDHITEGILRSLESERAHRQVAQLTATATRAAARELIQTLGSAQAREQLQLVTSSMVQTATHDLGRSLHAEFVPALREALERDLSAGAAGGLQGPLNDALGVTAQKVAYHAVLGANEGLRSSWLGEQGALGDLQQASEHGLPWLALLLGALGLVALSLVCAAVIVVARARRARVEVQRLESATLLLATAMRERHASGDTDEIVAVVRDALEKSAQEHQRHGLLGALRLRYHSHH
jgi:hypothetical protein